MRAKNIFFCAAVMVAQYLVSPCAHAAETWQVVKVDVVDAGRGTNYQGLALKSTTTGVVREFTDQDIIDIGGQQKDVVPALNAIYGGDAVKESIKKALFGGGHTMILTADSPEEKVAADQLLTRTQPYVAAANPDSIANASKDSSVQLKLAKSQTFGSVPAARGVIRTDDGLSARNNAATNQPNEVALSGPSLKAEDAKNIDQAKLKKLMDQKDDCFKNATDVQDKSASMSTLYDALAIIESDKTCEINKAEAKELYKTRGLSIGPVCSIKMKDITAISGGRIDISAGKPTAENPDGALTNSLVFDANHAIAGSGNSVSDWLYGRDSHPGFYTQLKAKNFCGKSSGTVSGSSSPGSPLRSGTTRGSGD